MPCINRLIRRKTLLCLLLVLTGLTAVLRNHFRAYARPGGASAAFAPVETLPNKASTLRTDNATKGRVADAYGRLPLGFEANKGQVDKRVQFLSHGLGYTLFLTSTEAVLALSRPEPSSQDQKPDWQAAVKSAESVPQTKGSGAPETLRMSLVGADSTAQAAGRDELSGKINYMIGSDPAKWQSDIPTYRKVQYDNVYPGVDMVYYGNQGQLEYDFTVRPEVSARVIRLRLSGAKDLKVDKEGDLLIRVEDGELLLHRPIVYQFTESGERSEVEASYALKGATEVGFNIGKYDPKRALVIDPVLVYATYLGGGSNEHGTGIAVDSSGNAYITGVTTSSNYPTTGAPPAATNSHIFISKLNGDGSALIYSTFVGGSYSDTSNGIAVDSAGNAYITGQTNSPNFPLVNPLQRRTGFYRSTDGANSWTNNANGLPINAYTNMPLDVRELVLSPTTPTTLYATTTDGIYKSSNSGNDWARAGNNGLPTAGGITALAIDPTGATMYAAVVNAGLYKSTDGGDNWSPLNFVSTSYSVFVIRVDPQNPSTIYVGTGNGLYKTTNGGTNWNAANFGTSFPPNVRAVTIDSTNPSTIYVGTTTGAFKSTNGGANFTAAATGMFSSTSVSKIAIDPTNASTIYAGTSDGIYKSINGAASWTKLSLPVGGTITGIIINPTTPSTIYVSVFAIGGGVFKSMDGGASWKSASSMLWDGAINALVSDPAQTTLYVGAAGSGSNKDDDAYVIKLNPAGNSIAYSTFVGGSNLDQGNGIALDSSNNIYLTGLTRSHNFPAVNALQPVASGPMAGGCDDAFVAKINPSGSAYVFSTYLAGSGCDTGYAIAADINGNAYVTGSTSSSNFPVKNALRSTLSSSNDAFVTKFGANGELDYSTFLGGSGDETGYGIAADASGNAYITGVTSSSNFPLKSPVQATLAGGVGGDAFVTALNDSGSSILYSTYLGGTSFDVGRGVALDADANLYLTGFTQSKNFPVLNSIDSKSGFFRSSNAGALWSNSDNTGIDGWAIGRIIVDPKATSTLYAIVSDTGSGARSIRKSTNGGRTWSGAASGIPSTSINQLAVDPVNNSTVYAATGGGVFKSTNGGANWSLVSQPTFTGSVYALAIDPTNTSTIYAPIGFGFIKSTDGGASWNLINYNANQFYANTSMVIDPKTPSTLYAGGDSGLFKSTDSGATWSKIGASVIGNAVIYTIAIDPVTTSNIYVGASNGLYKSVDGGNSWVSSVNQFVKDVAVDPVTPTTLYATSGYPNGIIKSTNGGTAWFAINNGLPYPSFSSIAVNPANPSVVYAGSDLFTVTDTDAFVTKLEKTTGKLLYSTYLGGRGETYDASEDLGYAIAVDSDGHAYVTGSTMSPNLPTTEGAYSISSRGFEDAFIAKLAMSYNIGGRVVDASNAGVVNVKVILSGSQSASVFTDNEGYYSFMNLPEGSSYTVTPLKAHLTFAPSSLSFNNLGSNQTADFVTSADPALYFNISGQLKDTDGNPLSNATVTLSGTQNNTATTDANGYYLFELPQGGNYTLAASLLGFTFAPPTQTVNGLSSNQTGNFTGSRVNFVVTNTKDNGAGSLRQAILNANATVGTDTIVFNIPGTGVQTISLQSVLPEIKDPVVINGTTQPGYAGAPIIELDGGNMGGGNNIKNGLTISAGSSTIRGLVINRFADYGIYLSTGGGNVVQGNYIGTDATGTIRRANNVGFFVQSNSENNIIGGTTAATRNVVSGNNAGLSIHSAGNTIQGNFIGTNAAGTAALPNYGKGMEVAVGTLTGPATGNLIGGTDAGAGNLISGNSNDGIEVRASGTLVQGNLIGTDVTGTQKIGNGIGIDASGSGVLIGGTTPEARNVIAGNARGITIESQGGAQTKVQGNFIGTDITGTKSLGNTGAGVVLSGNVLVGGTVAGARNVISANSEYANIVVNYSNPGSESVIQGNFIGTDVTGKVALDNRSDGIYVAGSNSIIGGNTPEARNIIAGNNRGISVGRDTTAEIKGVKIQGNFIGTDVTGQSPLPNASSGIALSVTASTGGVTVGGTESGAANLIAFNQDGGVVATSGMNYNITGNSIFSNAGLGIDLGLYDVTPNDVNDADTGPNGYQNFPVLTSASSSGGSTIIQGTLNSKPNTIYAIHFYSNGACDPSGNGEGARFFGQTNVTTDASGNANINATIASTLPAGRVITSTATDPAGNTSEFSQCDSSQTSGSVEFGYLRYKALEDVGNMPITVVRTGGSKGTITVSYSTSDGTALAGSDYTATTGTLTFAEGETSKTFNVAINNDNITEPEEVMFLTLTSSTDVEQLGGKARASLSILDSNTPLTYYMTDATVKEGDSGTTNAVITVYLSAATGRIVTADYTTRNFSATSGSDFQAVSGTLTFDPGTTEKTISVPVIGDTLNEINEEFTVYLLNTGEVIPFNSSSVIILNDDPLPVISVNDINVSEGNSGTSNVTFTVSLSAASGRSVRVNYATADGTATAASDYGSTSGTLTFSPGEVSKTLNIIVNGDTLIEGDETLFVNLSSPVAAVIGDGQGVCTIVNDDTAPTPTPTTVGLSSNSYSVAENSPSGVAIISVNRGGDTSTPITLDYATTDSSGLTPCQTNGNGIASDRCDYATAVGTLRFAAGEATKTIQIPIINDSYQETDEVFTITLRNAQGASLSIDTATVTINSDDIQAATQNPIDDQAFFIKEQYVDFLGRVAEPAGFDFWMNRMNNCPPGQVCDRIDTSQRFFQSDEFQERGFYVYRLYDAVLGRLPKYAEFVPDVARLNGPQTVQEQRLGKDAYLLDFMNKQEFRNLYGAYISSDGLTAIDAAGFVNALCAKSGITPASKQTLIDNLQNKVKDPAHTLEDFILTPEMSSIGSLYYDRGFITMQYFGYLRRDPDTGGFQFWVKQLIGPDAPHKQDYRFMVGGFLQSDEYGFRFALISATH